MGTHPIFESDFDCLTEKRKMMCGPSPVKPADDEAREILKTVKDALCEKTSHQGEAELLSYKTQVVAGTNYFMKVKFGDHVIHARIFQPLPHTGEAASLHSIDSAKHSHESEINYF